MKLDLSNSELGSSPSSPVSDCQRSCSRSTISTFFGDERSSYLVWAPDRINQPKVYQGFSMPGLKTAENWGVSRLEQPEDNQIEFMIFHWMSLDFSLLVQKRMCITLDLRECLVWQEHSCDFMHRWGATLFSRNRWCIKNTWTKHSSFRLGRIKEIKCKFYWNLMDFMKALAHSASIFYLNKALPGNPHIISC